MQPIPREKIMAKRKGSDASEAAEGGRKEKPVRITFPLAMPTILRERTRMMAKRQQRSITGQFLWYITQGLKADGAITSEDLSVLEGDGDD